MPEDEFNALDGLYKEIILDHYSSPRNYGKVENPDVLVYDVNPFCGDEVTITVDLKDHVVQDVKFEGRGCCISVASASMLTERIKGMKIEQVRGLISALKEFMHGKGSIEDMGDLEVLQGVKNFPVRIKCALLSWMALEKGLKEAK